MPKYLLLAFFIAISQSAGLIGASFTSSAIPTWYMGLIKPFFAPPNWLFAPAWITLYTLMGISAYLVYQKKGDLKFFWFQLVLNSLWSIIFFGLKNPLFALVEIIILWVAILETIRRFYRSSHTAAYLLIPYILWVTFATILNFSIVALN